MVTWSNVTVKLGELKPWADNPRCSSKAQAKRLLKSFDEFGQVQTVAVGPGLEVYDGHQRLTALLTVHGAEYKIDARQASEALADDDRRKLVAMLHAGAVGSWDWDQLANWNPADLIDWGFDGDAIMDWKRDIKAVELLMEAEKVTADAEPQIDRAAELNEKWQVRTGDLFGLGAIAKCPKCGRYTT